MAEKGSIEAGHGYEPVKIVKKRDFTWWKAAIGFAAVYSLFHSFDSAGWLGAKISARSSTGNAPQTYNTGAIVWSACTDIPGMHCGFLEVPLDWTAKTYPDERITLALRKLPAGVSPDQQLGHLLINPGGPGGSGTGAVANYGRALWTILEQRYSIVSWDPRGVNLTTPGLDCYPNEETEANLAYDYSRISSARQARAGLPKNASTAAEYKALKVYDSFIKATSDTCLFHGNRKVMESVSTAFTARDMKKIMEELGEGDKGLTYWGFSYGTILGATFAAMFPDSVHRVVVDGVSDAKLYTQDIYEWGVSGMTHTQGVLDGFFEACAKVGPERCAFAKTGSSPKDLAIRLENLYESLGSEPLPVANGTMGVGIVDASDLEHAVFNALYKPKKWPPLAQLLADLEKGDGRLLYEDRPRPYHKDKHAHHEFQSVRASIASLAQRAILCGDTEKGEPISLPDLFDYTGKLQAISPTGSRWARWAGECRHWPIEPLETYRGPWTKEEGLKKTKFPILAVSNTQDPVTPLEAAAELQRRFGAFGNDSASLLVQEGFGHCSLSQASRCTAKHIRDYFIDGILPKNGTLCESDKNTLFPTEMGVAGYSELDKALAILAEIGP